MSAKSVIPPGFHPIHSENPFGTLVGPIYEKRDGAGWVRGFAVREALTNRAGVVHGGMLMTFADILLSRAVLDAAKPPFATIQLESKFISPALNGAWVEGRARVLRATRELVFAEGTIASLGKPVMAVSGIFKIL
jgi:uncharacterized protein (TIGR00369 family)